MQRSGAIRLIIKSRIRTVKLNLIYNSESNINIKKKIYLCVSLNNNYFKNIILNYNKEKSKQKY